MIKMNANLLKTALYVCAFAAAGLPAWAGPLQRADVAGEPAWVLGVASVPSAEPEILRRVAGVVEQELGHLALCDSAGRMCHGVSCQKFQVVAVVGELLPVDRIEELNPVDRIDWLGALDRVNLPNLASGIEGPCQSVSVYETIL